VHAAEQAEQARQQPVTIDPAPWRQQPPAPPFTEGGVEDGAHYTFESVAAAHPPAPGDAGDTSERIARLELQHELFSLTQQARGETGQNDDRQWAQPEAAAVDFYGADEAQGVTDQPGQPAVFDQHALTPDDDGADDNQEDAEADDAGGAENDSFELDDAADTSVSAADANGVAAVLARQEDWVSVQPVLLQQTDTPPPGQATPNSAFGSSVAARLSTPPRRTSPVPFYLSPSPARPSASVAAAVVILPDAGPSVATEAASGSWSCGDASKPATSLERYVPPWMARAYANEMHIERLYDWQAECLAAGNGTSGDVLHRQGNLVYSAPTSGGKTLVAELLLFRYQLSFNLFRSHSWLATRPAESAAVLPVAFRSLFVVPFKALVQEKARDLQRVVRAMYANVQQEERRAAAASRLGNAAGPLVALPDEDAPQLHVSAIAHVSDFSRDSDVLVGVVTIEKAAMLLNALIAERRMEELGLVVIDVSSQRKHGLLVRSLCNTIRCFFVCLCARCLSGMPHAR